MRPRDPERPDVDRTGWRLRCAECVDVIGVYEPLVHLAGNVATHTSRAAEPGISDETGRVYHLACYEALEAQSDTGAK